MFVHGAGSSCSRPSDSTVDLTKVWDVGGGGCGDVNVHFRLFASEGW